MKVRFIPGPRLALLCSLSLPVFLLPGWGATWGLLWSVLLVAAALYEARALRRALPEVERRTDARLLLGTANQVRLRLRNASRLRLRVAVRDDTPVGFSVSSPASGVPQDLSCVLAPHARAELRYDVVPGRRGLHHFGDLHLRVDGLLRLGAVIASMPAAEGVRVYPNLRGPKRYELAVRLGALYSVGVRNLRRPGGGGEFEQLREYVAGDPYREIDWKATAKRRRPITRVNGQERSQTVIVALDAGRMMATQLDNLTKLDHAINAALLLAYVALRMGDKVGLIVFAEGVLSFVPPRRGQGHYRRLLDSLYAVEASLTYVDFRRLLEFINVRVPRRALIVMFSDLLDESQAQPMAEQAGLLRRRHLPLCVTMNDPIADALSEAPVNSVSEAYRRAAAADILAEREVIKAQLRKGGVSLVEARAGELALSTVNRYLEIKNRNVL